MRSKTNLDETLPVKISYLYFHVNAFKYASSEKMCNLKWNLKSRKYVNA